MNIGYNLVNCSAAVGSTIVQTDIIERIFMMTVYLRNDIGSSKRKKTSFSAFLPYT